MRVVEHDLGTVLRLFSCSSDLWPLALFLWQVCVLQPNGQSHRYLQPLSCLFFKCSWQQRLQKEKLGINPDTWLLHVTRSISEDYWKLSIIKALNGPSACYCRILTCQHAAHEQKITIGRNLTGSPLLSLGNLTLVPFFRTALGLWSACACMNKIVRATETTQKEPPSGCIWMWHFYLCFSQQICSAMMRSMRQSSHRVPWSHFDMSAAGMEAGRAAMND